eukprot:CAMPEP_0196586064 /NCGR_PEP_ID=MMETSP1081-20130531/53002_1 /TAXON_ID=36882 /ORGANISM="Pyramimonas amylifera, Strain CCMP720" /LENGTH=115 /DNA_ID=CAMNT_0041907815 /DNA_START=205 /DNA_END=552 /DNA_ORIENTATION=+
MRKGSHGSGEYALPGGHLEFGENWDECAVREVEEETGLKLDISRVKFAAVNNFVIPEIQKHYVTIIMRTDVPADAQPQNLEPQKLEEWLWVKWNGIPEPIFKPLSLLIESGYNPF